MFDGEYSNLGLHGSNQLGNAARHNPPDGVIDDFREAIDNTPKAAALIGAGALLMLVALKHLGFRFAVGVNVGR